MANPYQYSYKTNMTRNVTRKWAQAKQVDYGGDEWGAEDDDDNDDDDPYASDRYKPEPTQQPLSQAARSFTNPPAVDTQQRMSWDQGHEKHNFSAGATGTAPYYDFPPPQNRQPLRSSQPIGSHEPPGRTSIDSFRRDLSRPESRGSPASQNRFPPRKSSLGQQDFPDHARSQPGPTPAMPPTATTAAPATKPLPFIRPADIYKRMEEEREKERHSQDSSRPAMDTHTDSVRRDAPQSTPTPPADAQSNKRLNSTLRTLAEPRSNYLDNPVNQPTAPTQGDPQRIANPAQVEQVEPINTNLLERTLPSTSSRYTDESDPVSASTVDSRLPSRNLSQHDPQDVQSTRPALPPITRYSTFGSDLFSHESPPDTRKVPDAPARPPQDASESHLQHTPSLGYRSMVQDAFQSENQTLDSHPTANDSLLRSNTTSTSNISPIIHKVPEPEPEWDSSLATNAARATTESQAQSATTDEVFQPPRRLGTNRRDSASPARRPLSMEAPIMPEPQSAITSPGGDLSLPKDTAREAQMTRPGPAILVHQKAPSRESMRDESITASQSRPPALRNQDSYISEVSDVSNQRTTSEEWAEWNAARRDAHSRHGIQDSNPATPGPESAGMTSPAPPLDSLNQKVHTPAGSGSSNDSVKPLPGASSFSSQRPQVQRDESFRPSLPGGWMSSNSIQKVETPPPLGVAHQRPTFAPSALRSDSNDSIPTARAPREADWKSQYAGGLQPAAFAAAAAAGSALAGIFSGPSLDSRGTDSEVSSVDEPYEGPTGLNKDASMKARDFAATPPPPQTSHPSMTSDLAATKPDTSDLTPKARQAQFSNANKDKPLPLVSSKPDLGRETHSLKADSPTKDSERWWSDEDEEEGHTPAPAPLRTNRLSTIEPTRTPVSPVMARFESAPGPDAAQLESDIFKSLTPKSSNIVESKQTDRARDSSPLRDNNFQPVSPPFAAAALALSPAREFNTVQDQNTLQPLSAPHVKAQPPVNEKLRHLEPETRQAVAEAIGTTAPGSAESQDRFAREPKPLAGYHGLDTDSASPDQYPPVPSNAYKSSVHDDTPSALLTGADRPVAKPFEDSSPVAAAAVKDVESLADTPLRRRSTVNEAVTVPLREYQPPPPPPILTNKAPDTPLKDLPKPISTAGNTTSSGPLTPTTKPQYSAASTPETTRTTQTKPLHDIRPFPVAKVPIGNIVSMPTAQQRIQAYNENRYAYSQPTGQLENWLSRMNATDRADAFVAKPNSTTPYSTSPHHQRESSGTPSGTKQMQEDGKKLLASASKYGQKAGVLGKGLFSKGKEKLRTVSASQKGSPGSRSRNVSLPEVNRRASISNDSAPQLPTPTMATPIDETSLSTIFPDEKTVAHSRQPSSRAAGEPRFSPISEVSTNQADYQTPLDRTVSVISQNQSPQSGSTARPTNSIASAPRKDMSGSDKEDRTSAGVAGEANHQHNKNRVSTGMLNPVGFGNGRRNSSVSDVSSVSDRDQRRQSLAAGTISPPLESQFSRDQPPPPLPMASTGNAPTGQTQRSQHLSSYSTAMPTAPVPLPKDVEAQQDRSEEQTLPLYTTAQAPQPRILPGAQIVPIARIRQRQDFPPAEQSRPFSFAGGESLLHTGYGTNQSIDNLGVGTGSSILDQSGDRNAGMRQANVDPRVQSGNAESPLPSARRNPEDFAGRSPEEFARIRQNAAPIQTHPRDQEGFRIPGPYGQQLRSPKPKSSSPLLEQFSTTPASQQPHNETFGTGAPTANALIAIEKLEEAHSASAPFQPLSSSGPNQQSLVHQSQSSLPRVSAEGKREGEREREQSRPSKFTSMFQPRSKSRSRRLQKESTRDQRTEQRFERGQRNSLFKLGSRGSTSNVPRASEEDDEVADATTHASGRAGVSTRRLSKDMLRSTIFGQQGPGNHNQQSDRSQDAAVPAGKKKRFSGFFGKPNKGEPQQPTRASTLPPNTQQYYPQPHILSQQQESQPPLRGESYYSRTTSPDGQGPGAATIGESMYTQGRQPQSAHQQKGPVRGYYDSESETLGPYPEHPDLQRQQSFAGRRNGQESAFSSAGASRQQALAASNSPYQHDDRPYQHAAMPQQPLYPPPQRPELPRLNTGDRSHMQPTSAPVHSNSTPYYQPPHQTFSSAYQTTSPQPHIQHQPYQPIQQPVTSSRDAYRPPSTHANKDISYGSDFDLRYPQSNSNIPPLPATSTSTPQPSDSKITPRVAALHTRSRSPKLGRRSNEDLTAEYRDASQSVAAQNASPVAGLGTFNSKKVSPVGGVPRRSGEQERPYAIGLPGDEDEHGGSQGGGSGSVGSGEPMSSTSSKAREMRRIMLERSPSQQGQAVQGGNENFNSGRQQTVAERFMGVPAPAAKVMSPGSDAVGQVQSQTHPGPVLGNVMGSDLYRTPSVTISKNSNLRGHGPVRTSSPQGDLRAGMIGSNANSNTLEPDRSISMRRTETPISDFNGAVSREPSQIVHPQGQPRANPREEPISSIGTHLEAPIAQRHTPTATSTRSGAGITPSSSVSTRVLDMTPPPPVPSVSPPPAPDSIAAKPTTTNKAGIRKVMPTQATEAKGEVFEMPGSRPDGYESEEEVTMSATAYPGQEWQPVFEGWED